MKKLLLFIALLAFAFVAIGQVPEVMPPEYEGKYKRLERKSERWEGREKYDFVLDPIEQIPLEPSLYGLATGNWANDYLGINTSLEALRSRIKRPVTVYVFDTGGDYEHPLLASIPGVDEGRNFVGGGDEDVHGHSTHVAGCIAANSPEQPLGVARVLVEKKLLEVIPYKVLDDKGRGSYQNTADAVNAANKEARKKIAAGRFVIYNFSLGGGGFHTGLDNALKEAEALGVLISAAANGNTGTAGVQYPGKSAYTLGTAALQQSTGAEQVTRASYSSYGPETWAAAPGSLILSTWPPNVLRLASGTSMASPTLAGVFALLASIFPDATAAELRAHFIDKATDLGVAGKDDFYGYGAGLFPALMAGTPGKGPDEPDEPGDDPDEPEERPVAYSPTFQFDGPFRLRWQHHNYDDRAAIADGDYTILEEDVVGEGAIVAALRFLDITRVDITVNGTRQPEAKQWRELSQEVGRYLNGIAISAPDFMGPADITFWAAWFLDRQLTRKFQEDFTIELIEATGDGDSSREPPMYAYRKDGLKPYDE